MIDDLRAALRALRARPVPTLVATLCLGLGIGANVVLFGVIDALVLSPPPGITDAESVVRVRIGASGGTGAAAGAGSSATYPQFRRIASEQQHRLRDVAAYSRRAGYWNRGSDVEPLNMVAVTGDYFRVLGVRPQVGRFFDPSETAPGGGSAVVVLSHRLWESAFEQDAGVLGQSIRINGVPLTVVGVAPAGFVGADLGHTDAWISISLTTRAEFGGVTLNSDGLFWLQLVGRLEDDLTLDRAQAMDRAGPANRPAQLTDGGPLPVTLSPLRTQFYGDQLGQNPVPTWSLGISLAVLILACATVANLLLVQAIRRRRNVAIRLAMGSSPRRILRQSLLESLVISILSVGMAALVAWASMGLVRTLPIPRIEHFVTTRSMMLALGIAFLTPLLFGMAPAKWAAKRKVRDLLQGGRGGSHEVARLHRGFMVAQTAIGFVLLLGAVLFLQSLDNYESLEAGMDVDRIVLARMIGPGTPSPTLDPSFVTNAMQRVEQLPGIESVALASTIPFYLYRRYSFRIPDGRPDGEQPRSTHINFVSPEYFRTMGIGILEGRGLTENDRRDSPPVAVVSRRLAREYWGTTASPIGQCVNLRDFEEACVRVVGVAEDAKYQSLSEDPSAILYAPRTQPTRGVEATTMFIRTSDDPSDVVSSIRAEFQALGPSTPYIPVELLDARARPQRLRWELAGKLFGALGALAALLTAVGMYTVMASVAAQRKAELGVRSALGANPRNLLLLVLRRGLKVAVVGVGLGVLLGYVIGRILESQLFQVTANHLPSYLLVGAGLTLTALIACLGPGLTAARVEPARVLRDE